MPLGFAALLVLAQVPAAPDLPPTPVLDAPGHVSTTWPTRPGMQVKLQSASAPIPGVGPKLARLLRRSGPATPIHFYALDLGSCGATVLGQIGPVVSAVGTAQVVRACARTARRLDAPAQLKPLLELSRVLVGADRTDFGIGFDARYRGQGVLIAEYDSGIDLRHPDFRDDAGTPRTVAFWDQDATGTPPDGRDRGHLCREQVIAAGNCPLIDDAGHGTLVASIAAGNAPKHRGIAPEAQLVVATADLFDDFIGAMSWFDEVARERAQPLVVNLSLGGHEGAHDGTSMEAMAVESFEHLVVAAAGNEGRIPVHAQSELQLDEPVDVGVDLIGQRGPSEAWIEVWGRMGGAITVQVVFVDDAGRVLASSSTITPSDPGRSNVVELDGEEVAQLDLDAEVQPTNMRPHVRIDLVVPELSRMGGVLPVVRIRGSGEMDVWIDAPANVVSFPELMASGPPTEFALAADSERSVSDLATAPSAIAVSSFVSRDVEAGGGPLSSFSARGPSSDPERTGPKPDLAAPGEGITGASRRHRVAGAAFDTLYEQGSGTSMATPHVAGAAAVVLSAVPGANKDQVKAWLLEGARTEGTDDDARWGAGRLDVDSTVRRAVGGRSCICAPRSAANSPWMGLVIVALAVLVRRRQHIGLGTRP